jgi:hypothetical protein
LTSKKGERTRQDGLSWRLVRTPARYGPDRGARAASRDSTQDEPLSGRRAEDGGLKTTGVREGGLLGGLCGHTAARGRDLAWHAGGWVVGCGHFVVFEGGHLFSQGTRTASAVAGRARLQHEQVASRATPNERGRVGLPKGGGGRLGSVGHDGRPAGPPPQQLWARLEKEWIASLMLAPRTWHGARWGRGAQRARKGREGRRTYGCAGPVSDGALCAAGEVKVYTTTTTSTTHAIHIHHLLLERSRGP